MQIAELDYIRSSRAAQTMLAENYVGLPLGPVRSDRAAAGVVNMHTGATRPAQPIQASP
jgi:hypothetical protein